MKNLLVVTLLSTCMLLGCGGSKEMQVGEEQVVEQSSEGRPAWLSSVSNEQDGFMIVTGEISRAKERAFGMSQANADGIQKMLNTMNNQAKSASTQALRGANMDEGDVGRYSEFAVSWISNTYQISGVTSPGTYWEKVMKKTPQGVEYFFNCYVQLRISKADYNKALAGSYDEMKRKAQEANNAKAEEVAKKLLQDLNTK